VALPTQGYQDMLGRAPKEDEFGSDLSKVSGDFGTVLNTMRKGSQGFTTVKSGKTNLYVAYAPVSGTPFSLGIVARQTALLRVVTDLQQQVGHSTQQVLYYGFVPAGAVILLIVWLIGFMYIRMITNPINRLTSKTAEVASGNFEVEPEAVQSHDEIGQLASSFNRMVEDLRRSAHKIEQQNQELLHSQQVRLKASINSLRIGFVMTDPDNQVIMLNGAARQILSADHQDDRHNWTTDDIDARLGQALNFKESLQHVIKTTKPLDLKEVRFDDLILRVFIAPIVETNHKGAEVNLGSVVLLENITEAKQLEHSKDEFFSIASHELRTPLTAIRGNASLVQQAFAQEVHDQNFNEMMGDIHEASVRLIGIVNDFLDAARLEQGKIVFDNVVFNIHETLAAVSYELTTVAKEKGVALKIKENDGNPAVYADKNRVKQVVYNLVGNALKFTTKGAVTISTESSKDRLKVFVTDTGPGIPEAEQKLLFRKFRQASNNFTTRDASGTGLGLYISKLLCEQMGGQITLEHSQPGIGTTFSFTVPLATKRQQGAAGKKA
jgi:signal transduction histidine kinase